MPASPRTCPSSAFRGALALVAWGLVAAMLPNLRAQECSRQRARLAGAQLPCLQPAQLDAVLDYHNPAQDEHVLREALAAAAGVAACVNNVNRFPSNPEPREDFHCLQTRLLSFYDELAEIEPIPPDLHYQDVLARASLRFHYSLLDTELSIPEALSLVENALEDYQWVFRAAGEIRRAPDSAESLETAVRLGIKPDAPAPEFHYLEEFAAMAATNARRFPRALGNRLGSGLGPALCEAYELYPKHRSRIAHLYNLLIRFDLGNMAAAGQLDSYLDRLKDFFRPAPEMFSYLRLVPPDWAPTAPPCGEPDWRLVFPEFKPLPGLRPPPPETIAEWLSELESLLLQTAELAENRNHLWKAFHRHAELLLRLADSMKVGAARHESMRQTRRLLMEKARDALLMRGVAANKKPLDPSGLHAVIDRQISGYGGELLQGLQLKSLISFAETYVDAGETFLAPLQIEQLHRQLAVAYTLLDDPAQAQTHRQEANLTQAQLDAVRDELKQFGVGVKIQSRPGKFRN